jgi:hypothetical protein
MPVEAYVADRWKLEGGVYVADGIDTVSHHEPGNSIEDVAGVPAPSVQTKVQGNVRNLGMWHVTLGDATWAQYGGNNNVVWWLVYWVYQDVGTQRIVTQTNEAGTLTNPEWNALNSYLTGNGFSVATLGRNDTRGVLKDKVLAIFQGQP